MDERAEYWLSLADYDIQTARAMLQTKRYLYVGFMCHQTVEKSLKAVIARDCADDEIPPKIHNLLKLAESARLFCAMSHEHQAFIKKLNPMNVQARYPGYKHAIAAGLNEEMCRELIEGTEDILCWIKRQL
ncbi:MAG: HEPN domain-containing protein [Deltaproteobacteria bacterium]|nr:HEPN domain-containing protein [Deltaproteobacteria bacterium]